MSTTFHCPSCGHGKTSVTDSRAGPEVVQNIRRRRRCPACLHRFTTRELLDDADLSVLADLSGLHAATKAAVRQLIRSLQESNHG